MSIPLGPHDWAIRCNLVFVENGEMRDFTAGHITSEDGRQLVDALNKELGGEVPGGILDFYPGVSYRNILVYRGEPLAPVSPRKPKRNRRTTYPTSRSWIICRAARRSAAHRPDGGEPRGLSRSSREQATDRRGQAARDADLVVGPRQAPIVRPFLEVYGKRGAILSAVDLVRGTGMLIGWQRIDVPGATGYLDTTTAPKGR